MQVIKEIQFDYGHCVTDHESQCKNLHGHRARVLIVVDGDLVNVEGHPEFGMVMDFGRIKQLAMQYVHDVLDHAFIIWEKDPRAQPIQQLSEKVVILPFVPTAENLAYWIFQQLAPRLQDVYGTGLKLSSIHFYETPTSCAIYTGAAYA